ncbi:sensor domain-containing diguanylate cyclase [Vibrio methylphosphonaticus]|uniref:sensor domain-containing diguanylate cyclase n=1 Tax=Vibrio methylphosphonaticus TaxID=2946866 RepID=UPI002029DE6D|nr:GGDEF domain-containing protein [Vibrio methylphosphonaticus]MCL9776286.1 GGDEF domain-containing protein [Vibrio methylphosphonaticus]
MNQLDINKVDFKQAFNRLDSYFFIKDAQGCYVFVNEAICQLFNLSNEQILGKKDDEFFNLDESNEIIVNDQLVLSGQTVSTLEKNILKGNRVRYYQNMKSPLFDNDGEVIGIFGIAIDVSDAIAKKHELEIMVIRDELTGLYNRRFLDAQLACEYSSFQRHKQPFSLLMMDVDNFKAINDLLGHSTGDHVLYEIGKIMLESLRVEDYCCRFGGDEFAILLPNTELRDAFFLGERLREAVAAFKFTSVDGRAFSTTVSIGASHLTEQEEQDGLTNMADAALMQAKRKCKNSTLVYCHKQTIITKCTDCDLACGNELQSPSN